MGKSSLKQLLLFKTNVDVAYVIQANEFKIRYLVLLSKIVFKVGT